MVQYKTIINKFSKKKILVIGDVILDQYIRGTVSRISPEAPVPVVLEQESFYTPGGAANVAHNLRALGAQVKLVGRIGNDDDGVIVKNALKKKGIQTQGLFIDPKLPTVKKTRVMAQHQQVVRIDRERTNQKGSGKVLEKIVNFLNRNIDQVDAVIISDYGKGLITPELINEVCTLAQSKKKILTVDPKVEHFKFYRNVTAITPNLNEAENAIRNIKITSPSGHKFAVNNDRLIDDESIDLAGRELVKYLSLQSLLITLGERGMRLFEKGKKPVSIKTKAREVYDVSGAGDAVISVFTLSLTTGASKHEAADIANAAAGIVVGKLGAVAVSKDELLKEFK